MEIVVSNKKFIAELKSLISADVDDLKNFSPNGDFGIPLEFEIGISGEEGADLFQVRLCTPKWFEENVMTDHITSGTHFLFTHTFDYLKLLHFFESYCKSVTGGSWEEMVPQLQKLGSWEFDNYQPYIEGKS